MINILHIRSSVGIFGADQVILNLLSNHNSIHFKYFVAGFHEPNNQQESLMDAVRMLGIPVFILPESKKFSYHNICNLKSIIHDQNIHILHSHDFKSNFYAMATLWGHKPHPYLVTTMHGTTNDSPKMQFYNFTNNRIMNRIFDGVIAVSKPLENELRQWGIPPENISYIPNGIAPSITNTCISKLVSLPEKRFTIGIIARIFPDKGHKNLFNAVHKILNIIPEIQILVVGDGPYINELQEFVRNNGLTNCVQFLGTRYDINYLLSLMDVFVLPSHREGTPISILEAMLAEKLIIASKVGNIPFMINNHEEGLLFDPHNSDQLSENIIWAYKNPLKRKIMGKKAKERVTREFSALKMAKDTETFYTNIVNKK